MTLRWLAVVLLGLTLAGCGGGDAVTGQVSEAANNRLCLQTTTQAGLCFVATTEQLDGVDVGTCVEVTFDSAPVGDQPTVSTITPKQAPCVTTER